jgi:hypothetical protein
MLPGAVSCEGARDKQEAQLRGGGWRVLQTDGWQAGLSSSGRLGVVVSMSVRARGRRFAGASRVSKREALAQSLFVSVGWGRGRQRDACRQHSQLVRSSPATGRRKSREAAEVETAGAMAMGAGLWSVARKRASASGDSGMHRHGVRVDYIL